MSNAKAQLRKAVFRFKRQNPAMHCILFVLAEAMKQYILESGKHEISVGYNNKGVYVNK